MAYVQNPSSRSRYATLTAVAALHAAAIYALVSGFAGKAVEEIYTTVEGRNIPVPEPSPSPDPVVEPEPNPIDQKIFVPKPLLPLPPKDEATVLDLTPLPQPKPLPGSAAGDGLLPVPSPTSGLVAPKAPIPLDSPGKWATSADYPASELRREIEGTARFRVTVGTDGRVRNCEIVASSGSSGLDRATCENVARRARFKPATDETGATVSGSYSNAIRWEIPD